MVKQFSRAFHDLGLVLRILLFPHLHNHFISRLLKLRLGVSERVTPSRYSPLFSCRGHHNLVVSNACMYSLRPEKPPHAHFLRANPRFTPGFRTSNFSVGRSLGLRCSAGGDSGRCRDLSAPTCIAANASPNDAIGRDGRQGSRLPEMHPLGAIKLNGRLHIYTADNRAGRYRVTPLRPPHNGLPTAFYNTSFSSARLLSDFRR